jgi:hypothetical protein
VKDKDDQEIDMDLYEAVDQLNEETEKLRAWQLPGKLKENPHDNLMKVILPLYCLSELPSLQGFGSVYRFESNNVTIYENDQSVLKM